MSSEPGSDPIGEFQRWLMKAGAKSIGREVAGRVKSTLGTGGGGRGAKQADVWETVTTEELTEEPPECQWCPICRAARRYRDSGSAGAGQFAGVGDTLAGLTRDAFSLFDAAVRASQRPADAPRPSSAPGRPADQSADRPLPTTGGIQTTAPSSSDPESGGRPLSIRSTRMTKPPTKAATARKAASPEMVAPTAVLMSK